MESDKRLCLTKDSEEQSNQKQATVQLLVSPEQYFTVSFINKLIQWSNCIAEDPLWVEAVDLTCKSQA